MNIGKEIYTLSNQNLNVRMNERLRQIIEQRNLSIYARQSINLFT